MLSFIMIQHSLGESYMCINNSWENENIVFYDIQWVYWGSIKADRRIYVKDIVNDTTTTAVALIAATATDTATVVLLFSLLFDPEWLRQHQ
jgi:hypothetical protein